jgi:hypothetical protein
MNWLKIFTVLSILAQWSTKALADGKVTAPEALDLGIQLASVLGLPTEIDLPFQHLIDAKGGKPS